MGLSLRRLGFFASRYSSKAQETCAKEISGGGSRHALDLDPRDGGPHNSRAVLKSFKPSHGVTVITRFPLPSVVTGESVAYSIPDVQFGKSLLAELAANGSVLAD